MKSLFPFTAVIRSNILFKKLNIYGYIYFFTRELDSLHFFYLYYLFTHSHPSLSISPFPSYQQVDRYTPHRDPVGAALGRFRCQRGANL